MLHDVI